MTGARNTRKRNSPVIRFGRSFSLPSMSSSSSSSCTLDELVEIHATKLAVDVQRLQSTAEVNQMTEDRGHQLLAEVRERVIQMVYNRLIEGPTPASLLLLLRRRQTYVLLPPPWYSTWSRPVLRLKRSSPPPPPQIRRRNVQCTECDQYTRGSNFHLHSQPNVVRDSERELDLSL